MQTSEQTIRAIASLAKHSKAAGELESSALLYTLASVLGQPNTGELARWLEFGNESRKRQIQVLNAMVERKR